jgi:3-oxoadipate enol-lactonase/4-carboxymuconolactone decarboxylase
MLRWTTTEWTGPFVAVCIPSLGQRGSMWNETLSELPGWSVCTLDLPGHGDVKPASGAFSLAELGAEVAAEISQRRLENTKVLVLGCSIGGAIGLAIAATPGHHVDGVVIVGAAATIGDPVTWSERAALVRQAGPARLREGSKDRWFSEGYQQHHAEKVSLALDNLDQIDRESYALCCEALGAFDMRSELSSIHTPVLVISGEHDAVSPSADGRALAEALPHGSFVEVQGVRHLIPLEAPLATARAISDFAQKLG